MQQKIIKVIVGVMVNTVIPFAISEYQRRQKEKLPRRLAQNSIEYEYKTALKETRNEYKKAVEGIRMNYKRALEEHKTRTSR